MNTKLILVAVLGIGAFAGLLFWIYSQEDPTIDNWPRISQQQPQDSTAVIQADLQDIDLGDLDKEFQEIDQELNTL